MSQLLDRKSVIEAHFDSYAGSWRARLQEHAFAARYEAVRRIAAKLDPRGVLDVGCRTGDYCVFFDPVWTDYLGIDISPKMVDECRRAYPAYRFEVGDAERTTHPTNRRTSISILPCWGITTTRVRTFLSWLA